MNYVYKKPYVRLLMRLFDAFGYVTLRKRPPRKVTAPQHIVFLALHQIGDVVMTLPTIDAIAQMSPEAKHTIVAGGAASDLISKNRWGSEVIPFDAAWQKVVRQQAGIKNHEARIKGSKQEFIFLLQKLNADALVIFHPDLIVNQLTREINVPYILGFANAGGGFYLTSPVDMPEAGHQVERNYALAEAFAKQFNTPLPSLGAPSLTPTADIAEIIKDENIDLKKAVILHPFASAEAKNWLPERWNEIVGWINDHKLQPIIIGGPNDSLALTNPAINLAGKLSLPETAALLSQSKLFVGIDSGPGHIAAAVGCPAISIYSSAHDPLRWAPYGEKVTILHKPVKDRVKFPYEVRDIPDGVEVNPYIDQITSENVIQAIEKLL